ncbi:MAG TPA: GLUG motif-containing protein, partial [Xanthobacteraceae bacterium]|nr:GLUG motif-containing protein [Xanthobacteraceae bacterium]
MTRCLRNLALATTALLPLGIGFAVAGPEGGVVVGGGATISGQGGANVTINQTTPRAIINWHTFNIGAGETTRFNQPDSSSVTLNRVTGGLGPSEINGTLTANGRIFIVNRDGMLFGAGAVVNTAGFLATTSDIKNSDFMAGRYNFNIPGRPDASIVNHGTITATNSGFAALVAPGVRNTGTITATMGTVALASGNSFTLDFYGDKLITLEVGDAIGAQVRDVQTGLPLKSLVENSGKLSANGGRVELTAAAARQVVDSVINNKGVVEANAIGQRGGTIRLSAATAATKGAGAPKQTIKISGTLSAAGKDKGKSGGKVVVTGEDIQLKAAKVDVSGPAGGGTALIGGDWGGGNPNTSLTAHPRAKLENEKIANASTVTIDSGSVIDASATQNGTGGKVVVWSDVATSFAGLINARGGAEGGDGGFVEVSGKQKLDYKGLVDLRAPNGTVGKLLLDPADYYIEADNSKAEIPTGASVIKRSALQDQLAMADVTIATNNSASLEGQHGDIFVNTSVDWSSNTTLTLSAYRDITLRPGIKITNTYAGADAGTLLVMRADSSGTGNGTVNFVRGDFQCECANPSKVDFSKSTGKVTLFYNPPDGYNTAIDFVGNGHVRVNPTVPNQFIGYMLVNNSNDLQAINQNKFTLTQNYALGRNIEASNFEGWTPIGDISTPFSGRLNGLGNTISGLTIAPTNSTVSSIGLFGVLGSTAVVQDLKLADLTVRASPGLEGFGQYVGTLAGQNFGQVVNVFATGTVDGRNLPGVIAGGLVGQNGGDPQSAVTALIDQSHADVKVSVGNGLSGQNGGWNTAGGLVGYNWANAQVTFSGAGNNSADTVTVSGGNNSFVGGLVGRNDGFIGSGSASVAASGTGGGVNSTAVGGLVGFNSGTISRSHASGPVSGTGDGNTIILGGLAGMNDVGANGTPGLIVNSFASGSVTATGDGQIGGLVGGNFAKIESSYATGAVSIQNGGGTAGGLVGWNNSSGTIEGSYATGAVSVTPAGSGSSFVDVTAGGLVGDNQGGIANSYATGAVTSTGGDIISLGGLVGSNDGTISNSYAKGNVSANSPADSAVLALGGFAGFNSDSGEITNSYATGNVSANNGFVFAGGFVGSNSGAITNTPRFDADGNRIADASGNVTLAGTATGAAGGFAGVNVNFIDQSVASGAVSGGDGAFVAGFAGWNAGLISQSSAGGAVTGGDNSVAAGFVALNVGEVRNGAATGAATGGHNSTVGGLVAINFGIPNFVPGNADGAQFTLSQPGLVTQSFATGPVAGGDGSFVGGLVALNLGTISQSFASGAVTGGADSSVGGLVAVNFGLPDLGPGNASFPQFTLGTTGAISQAYATGAVTGGPNSTVGGLVAFNGGTIDQTYSIGKVTGGPGSTLGGLVAVNSASFNLPTLPTVPSDSAGVASASARVASDSAGVASDSVSVTSASGSRQLAGSQQLASAAVTGTVTNSYWDVTTSGLSTSAAGDPFPTSGGLPPGFVPNPWTENTPNFPCLAGLPCTQVARPIPTPDLPPPPPPPPVVPDPLPPAPPPPVPVQPEPPVVPPPVVVVPPLPVVVPPLPVVVDNTLPPLLNNGLAPLLLANLPTPANVQIVNTIAVNPQPVTPAPVV